MTDIQTATVIRAITDRLKPVVPLWPLRRRMWTWTALSVLSLITVTTIFGVRRNLPVAALGSTFVLQVLAMGALAGVSAAAGLRLSVPGADRLTGRILAFGVLGLWPCALLTWDLLKGGTVASLATEPLDFACVTKIGIGALLPAIAIAVMIRRGAPLRPCWAAAMAGMAAAGVGAVGVALTCPVSRLSHLLVSHALPTIAVAGAVWAAASAATRRRAVSRLLGTIAFFAVIVIVSARGATPSTAGHLPQFRVTATTTGYLSSDALLKFLRGAHGAAAHGVAGGRPSNGQAPTSLTSARPRPHTAEPTAAGGWHQSLEEGLAVAGREGKPVFLDVWANWCESCVAMDATTFRDPKVREALDGYVKVRVEAEDVEKPDVSALLDRLDSAGLPTYAVLQPAGQN
jgi:thiol-disulfide isomerase/thioredoxin